MKEPCGLSGLRPRSDIEGDAGWRNYAALGAQVDNTPEWGAELMDKHFDPVVLQLIKLLKKALPGSSKEDIFWSYHFVSGALMLTLARTGRIDKLSGGACRSEDFAAVKERMSSFMAGGFLAVYGQRVKKIKREMMRTDGAGSGSQEEVVCTESH